MIRKALLLGNTRGLEGVKVDIKDFSDFLKSDFGGGWLPNELEIKYNINKAELLSILSSLKVDPPDLLIILFSGHGGQERKTILELNSYGETIEENQLRNIGIRQINIYDCCRSYPENYQENVNVYNVYKSIYSEDRRKTIRHLYEKRILQSAKNQQILLYSCRIGEKSYDTPNGAVYLNNFLKAAKNLLAKEKLVIEAHQEAIEPTRNYSKKEFNAEQNPQSIVPKLLTNQQLIISINPNQIN